MGDYPEWLYDEYTDNLYGIDDEAYLELLPAPREVIDDIPF